MLRRLTPFAVITALVLAVSPAAASTTVMEFDEVATNGLPFPQTIGDSANVDVSHRSRTGFGDATIATPHVLYWQLNYSELEDVAYPSANGRVGEFQFDIDPGFEITIDSFRFGNFSGGVFERDATFRIFDSVWSQLWELPETGHTGNSVLVEPSITSTGTLYFQWGTDWNIGIDDFTYTTTPISVAPPAIPLPAGLPLAAGALGMLALLRRRKT